MKEKETILFDLDGTLIDSSKGIIRNVKKALAEFGVQPEPDDDMRHVIGPPIGDTFSLYYKMGEKDSIAAIASYRKAYEEDGIHDNTLYPGVKALVKGLSKAGKTLLVATSKPEPFALLILEKHGLLDCFKAVGGCGMQGERNSKAEVIFHVLQKAGIANTGDCIMVGDRIYDVEGAAKAGFPCIGVLHGFGSREELEQAGAIAIAKDSMELAVLLGISI